MRIDAVIFDLDGTLYDRSRLPLRILRGSLFQWRFINAERKSRRSLAGRRAGMCDLFEMMAGQLHCGENECRTWFEGHYMPLMVDCVRKYCHPRPWVARELERLRRENVKTAVLSDYPCVNEKLQALGLSGDDFDIVADAPSLGGFKPCALPFLNMAEKLGVDTSATLVVGDRDDTDGEGARKAGMRFALCGPNYEKPDYEI